MAESFVTSPLDLEVVSRDLDGGNPAGLLFVTGVTPKFDVGCPMRWEVLSGEGSWTMFTVGEDISEGDKFDFPWGYPVRFSGRMVLGFAALPATEINSTGFDEYPPTIYSLYEREIRNQSWIWPSR